MFFLLILICSNAPRIEKKKSFLLTFFPLLLQTIFKQMNYFGFYPSPKQFVSLLQLCEEKKKERIDAGIDGEVEVGEVREVGGGDGAMAEYVLRFYENIGEGKEKLDVFPLLMALQIHFTNQDMGKFEKRFVFLFPFNFKVSLFNFPFLIFRFS